MIAEPYQEAEIQALIVLIELTDPVETPNNNFYTFYPKTVPEAQTYFRRFVVNLTGAYENLQRKGLVARENDQYHLTDRGRSIAAEIRWARPPIWYWYRDFYEAIETSAAFSEYARRVFGRDLSQHGFSNMDQLHQMLALINLTPTSRVLDIGCGNGKIAEYISDLTQAAVTGVDYAPTAIAQAVQRTKSKSDRLHFYVSNIEDLDLGDKLFDVILSIDSIFFGKDLSTTVARLKSLLWPGGQMAIFCGDELAAALRQNGLSYDVYDFSRENYAHQQLKHQVATELQEAFAAEGNSFIWENLMAESNVGTAPYDPANSFTPRFLCRIKT